MTGNQPDFNLKKNQLVMFLLSIINILEFLVLPLAWGTILVAGPYLLNMRAWIWGDYDYFIREFVYINGFSIQRIMSDIPFLVGLALAVIQVIFFIKMKKSGTFLFERHIFQYAFYYNFILGCVTTLLSLTYLYYPLAYALIITNLSIILYMKKILHVPSHSSKIQGLHLFFHAFLLFFIAMLFPLVYSLLPMDGTSSSYGNLLIILIMLPFGVISPVNACIYYIKKNNFGLKKK